MSLLEGWKRSHRCAETAGLATGATVTVMGWVQKRRNLGGLVFIDLRDRSGIVQLVVDAEHAGQAAFALAADVRQEFVLAVQGTVRARVGNQVNEKMATGHLEIWAEAVRVLSESAVLPYNLDDERASDQMRYQYRYLDLRQPRMQANLLKRHEVCRAVREHLSDNAFFEIETPMLCRSTPEGARDYLVPSRIQPGTFYALPQSPQIYKQLLMHAGYDRYFQLARCFRDEDLRADRQPEFTQIDMEMAFVEADDVMAVAEGMMNHVFEKTLGHVPVPVWPRMTYAAALDQYGSDKPDTRFDMLIQTVNPIFQNSDFPMFGPALKGGRLAAICVPGGAAFTRKEIDALAAVAKTYRAGGLAWYVPGEMPRGSIVKAVDADADAALRKLFDAGENDLFFVIADADAETASIAMGQVRLEVARKLNLLDAETFCPVWVTEFPFFEYDKESGSFMAMHHPFTMPVAEDLPLLASRKQDVRAQAYDMVINGVEIASGSIRIHDSTLQEQMFAQLGFSHDQAWERFGFLLEAFRYGTPPHGGIALGLDRLVMLLCGADTIRDVIAFPKMQNASDLMTEAPNCVPDEVLKELKLACVGVKG